MRIALIFLTLLTFHVSVYSQARRPSEFIITNAGETIPGQVTVSQELHSQILFKRDGESDFREYTPKTIQGFGFSDRFFERKTFNNQTFFYEVLVRGASSLLKLDGVFYLENGNNGYKLESVKKEVTIGTSKQTLEDKAFLGILKQQFTDCPKVEKLITKTELQEESLRKLFTKYNTCDKNDRESEASRLGVGIVGGYSMLSFNKFVNDYSKSFGKDLRQSNQALFGLSVTLVTKTNMFLTLNGQVQNCHHESTVTTSTTVETVVLKYQSLSFPFAVNYRFIKDTRRASPFIGLGFIFNKVSFNENSRKITLTATDETDYYDPQFSVKKSNLLVLLQAGFNYYATPNISLSGIYRYEAGRAYIDERFTNNMKGPNVSSHSFQLNVSYIFGR